jgi:hypothetical protein
MAGDVVRAKGKGKERPLLVRVLTILAAEIIPRRYDKTVYLLFFLLFATLVALALSLKLR